MRKIVGWVLASTTVLAACGSSSSGVAVERREVSAGATLPAVTPSTTTPDDPIPATSTIPSAIPAPTPAPTTLPTPSHDDAEEPADAESFAPCWLEEAVLSTYADAFEADTGQRATDPAMVLDEYTWFGSSMDHVTLDPAGNVVRRSDDPCEVEGVEAYEEYSPDCAIEAAKLEAAQHWFWVHHDVGHDGIETLQSVGYLPPGEYRFEVDGAIHPIRGAGCETPSSIEQDAEDCRITLVTLETAVEAHFAQYQYEASSIQELVDTGMLRSADVGFDMVTDTDTGVPAFVPTPGGACDGLV